MKEALIMLITEQLGAGNWDLLPTGDLYRIFSNLKQNQDKERTNNFGLQNPDFVKAFPTADQEDLKEPDQSKPAAVKKEV